MSLLLETAILGLAFGGVFALIAAGLTLIYALTRHINVAHGNFMVLAMYFIFVLYQAFRLDPYLSLPITVISMFILGLLIFRFSFLRVINSDGMLVFQFFLGYVLIIENALLMGFSADYLAVPTFLTLSKVTLGNVVLRTSQVIALIVSVAVASFFYWMLRKTEFGRSIRAVAQNPEVAALMGVNVRRVQMLVFAMAFALLGLAATLVTPLFTFSPYTGFFLTLFALIILMLGGMGNFIGALVGGLIIGFIYGISYMTISSNLAPVVPYTIFILLILFRPQGLFGAR